MEKVAPSARFRAELDEALAGVAGERDPIETVGRLGARLILQQALEDEITEFLGRDRYERTGEPVSHRNGYCRVERRCSAYSSDQGGATRTGSRSGAT
jgi:putative transposase